MDQSGVLEDSQSVKKLSHEDFDELGAQTLELILFDQLVEIGGQQFKDETEMVPVDK